MLVMRKYLLFLLTLVCLAASLEAAGAGRFSEIAIYQDEYALNFFPAYPPLIGESTLLRLKVFAPAQKVTLITDRFQQIELTFRGGYWWGRFNLPADYQEGGHYFTVWIKRIDFDPRGLRPAWSKSVVWYQAFRAKPEAPLPGPAVPLTLESGEAPAVPPAEPLPEAVVGEGFTVRQVGPEGDSLQIKGTQSISFKTRSLEGSKEGYAPGIQQVREESLRLNISGRAAETEIEASLFRSTALGIERLDQRDEEVSIRLRRGSTEAYLGDYRAELNETEFAALDQVLSGGRLKGDYGNWGFAALYSSPKGFPKYERFYGNGTQGPYTLRAAPVVIDSERVKVDGVVQRRGESYRADYQAGTIIFLRSIVDARSVIEVHYDQRQTVYQHATYATRAYFRPNEHAQLGWSYLNDSDSLAGARDIRNSLSREAVDPRSHQLFGLDGSYVSENLSANAELAYSVEELDLLSVNSTRETGRAGKLSVSSTLGPLGLTAAVKRIGPRFRKIADADPQQDLWEYGWGLSYRPGQLLGARTDQNYQQYRQGGVLYENRYRIARALLTPEQYPSLEYSFRESAESNDPVSGAPIGRAITRNAVESVYQRGILSGSLRGATERWLRRSPSEEATDYRRLNAGLATVGTALFSFTSNLEVEERREPDGRRPNKRSYDLNLTLDPAPGAFLAAALQQVEDSAAGPSTVTDLSYRWQPGEVFRTEGKYTVNSLRQDFPATAEAVGQESASLSLDLRPRREFRLRLLYKPNFTRIIRTRTLSYSNEQRQAELNFLPTKFTLLGALFRQGDAFNVYQNDWPDYRVKDRTERTDSTLYTFKYAPWEIISTEFNHGQDNSVTRTRVSSAEPYLYQPGSAVNRKADLVVRTTLSEKFSLDSRYTFHKSDRGSGEAGSDLLDTKSHTASLKGNWNVTEQWSFSLSGAYSRLTDYLLRTVTYTLSPGCGFIYRLGDRLRTDLDYLYSRSYSGAETEKHQLTVRTRYAVSDYVNLTVQAAREQSRAPDFGLTDLTGNIEINL